MPKLNSKQLNLISNYVISSRIEDYFELPDNRESAIDKEDDFYIIKLRSTLQLSKDAKIVKGIQRRLMLAIKNSIADFKFSRYASGDTFVSVNTLDDRGRTGLLTLNSLESMIDKTSSKTVSIFLGTMNNGYSPFSARMDEKQARIYMHKDMNEMEMFYFPEPFIASESDREWLLARVIDKIELAKQVHF